MKEPEEAGFTHSKIMTGCGYGKTAIKGAPAPLPHNKPLDGVDYLLEKLSKPKVYCQPNDHVFTLISACREDIEDALKCPEIASDCLNAALGRLSLLTSVLKGGEK